MSVPVELYRIAIDASVWTWTSSDAAVDYNGETYTPQPIGRSEMEQGQEMNRQGIQLRVPRTNPLALLYLTEVPDYAASVTLFRQEGASTDIYWKGRIVGASGTGSEVTLECESVFTSLRRVGLRARYQIPCIHAVYHRGCNLALEDFAVPARLTAITGALVTVPEAAAQADGWYRGGLLRDHLGVLRWIVDHAGDQLTLQRANTNLAAAFADSGYGYNYGNYYGGIGVTIYPGCDRSLEICDIKFNNSVHHLGFRWFPTRNPFDGSSIV